MKLQIEAGPLALRKLEEQCRQKGLPLTIQRRVIFELLVNHQDHPTADEIFQEVKVKLPGVSRTTVYRVLETLVGMGLAHKINHPDAAVRFDPMTHRHHHLVCEGCGQVQDWEDDSLSTLELPNTRQGGFKILDYSIYFNGICNGCQSKK